MGKQKNSQSKKRKQNRIVEIKKAHEKTNVKVLETKASVSTPKSEKKIQSVDNKKNILVNIIFTLTCFSIVIGLYFFNINFSIYAKKYVRF